MLAPGAPLGAALEALGGREATLWELAAIVSVPGAPPQIVHADAMWTESPLLLTAFVALQPVTRAMGPTRFLPRTHAHPSHARVVARGDATELGRGSRPPPSWVGLLDAGDAALYDGRLLHCGGANRADRPRALLYVTFRAAAGGAGAARRRGGGGGKPKRTRGGARTPTGEERTLAELVDELGR